MTEQLPISIHISDNLIQQFAKIISVCNKLEAQLNFQTMIANWYGDEDSTTFVQLSLDTPDSFAEHKKNKAHQEVQNYCDDVFSYRGNMQQKQLVICHIAITDSELALLNQQSKLLAGLLRVKLQKVLNLLAKQLKLPAI